MDEETIEYIEGTVLSVIFRNEENGYTIVSARISGYDDKKTVVGTFPYLVQGELFSALGVWTEHKQYGEQFTAESLKTALPTSASDIFDFISGGFIKGVGPATASLIVNEFGEESLKIIENFPEKLTSVKGISRKKAQQISDDFKKQVGIGRMISGLCDYGIEYSHALRMYKYYGDNALRVLEGNPYVICANHIGGSFAAADSVALALGFEEYSQQRIEAAIF